MKYTIELPDVIKDADGVEYEPTGEWRCPLNDERCIVLGSVKVAEGWWREERIILRQKFLWPIGIGGWGFTRDRDSPVVFFHPCAPEIVGEGWRSGRFGAASADFMRAIGVSVPVITDWRVPVLNPNYKAKP